MTRPVPQDPDDNRLDEAIAWRIELGAPDADENVWLAFTAWLEADSANRLAYDRVENLEADLAAPALAHALREIPAAPNVVEFGRAPHTRNRIRVWAWIAAAALAAASIVVAVILPGRNSAPLEFATRVGQTKAVALSDGTRIDLNTDTRISVETTRAARRVVLEKGEALFHVTPNSDQPFLVNVGDRVVRDVGTIFDIVRNGADTTIVVAEGRVVVQSRRFLREPERSH